MDYIETTLQQASFEPGCLNLEVTETALMSESATITEHILRLKALGVCLHIDDFGTGYSSLSYLHHFSFDSMKIDRSFIRGMSDQSESSEIVKTIIQLAHNLRMSVVAEGVETVAQMSQLRNLGCEFAQGYLFSKPLEAAGVEEMLLYKAQDGFYPGYPSDLNY